jgi:chromosome segregation ATPase
MSGKGLEELKILNKKLDELLIRYETLKEEYKDIKAARKALENKLQERDAKINELETKYEKLRITGALLGEGENATVAKKKITELVREIDRCVALLNR